MNEKERAETLARVLALHAIRNTELEDFHAGTSPSSVTGDYSDVKVVSPYGEIPWKNLSRLSDPEMRVLMLSVEGHLAAMLQVLFSLVPADSLNRLDEYVSQLRTSLFGEYGVSWDDPRHKG